MTLQTRKELEAAFKNGRRPSQADYAALISSTLNKRDDQFHGRWMAGTTYRTGDVVIHDRGLWEVTKSEVEDPREICSHTPPDGDSEDWQSLLIPGDDNDWILVDILEDETDEEEELPATMHANPRVVRVGIGTNEPRAFLDVLDESRGRLLFDGCERPGAMLRLVRLSATKDEGEHYLALWLDDDAAFVSDAPAGFVFTSGGPQEVFCQQQAAEANQPLLAIKQDGRVGVGTSEPRVQLEVVNRKESGGFLFNLDQKVNPALAIVNLRPGCRENYLTSGVNNDIAVFVTDSDYGFVFRAGGEFGTDGHEIDIDQGKDLVSILPDGKGKLGIGRNPGDYQLDVDGVARAYGLYVETDACKMEAVDPLCSVLGKISDLRPVFFEWQDSIVPDDDGRKIGFVAHEVEEVFPEAVKTNDHDRAKAVAYDALVPVLVKGLQEQQETIAGMQRQLEDLAKRVAELEDPEANL